MPNSEELNDLENFFNEYQEIIQLKKSDDQTFLEYCLEAIKMKKRYPKYREEIASAIVSLWLNLKDQPNSELRKSWDLNLQNWKYQTN